MKKILFTVIAAAISYCIAIAQPCLPEGITFTTQEQIDNFQTNYPGCTEIEGDVTIFDDLTGSLYNLSGLNVLTSIGGYLSIHDNIALSGLSGLDNLTFIGDNLLIGYNDALTNLSGLENLISIGGGFWIRENDLLSSLNGLVNLTSIEDYLDIQGNNVLNSLNGLENLTSIGDYLGIRNNDALTNMSGIENVSSIGSYLEIYNNNILISLSGLENINAESIGSLHVFENYLLSQCEAQSICDYLTTPNGTIEIHDNASGCNSPEEVKEACPSGLEDINIHSGLIIIPNPSNDIITISSSSITGNTQLSISNISGEKVLERQLTDNETQLDISALPRGVYFVRLQDEKTMKVEKMIKR
jgi:hypothetical protein